MPRQVIEILGRKMKGKEDPRQTIVVGQKERERDRDRERVRRRGQNLK